MRAVCGGLSQEGCHGLLTRGAPLALRCPVFSHDLFYRFTDWREMTAATEITVKLFQTAVHGKGKWLLLKALVFRTLRISESSPFRLYS